MKINEVIKNEFIHKYEKITPSANMTVGYKTTEAVTHQYRHTHTDSDHTFILYLLTA